LAAPAAEVSASVLSNTEVASSGATLLIGASAVPASSADAGPPDAP
jgi:hypothetical protein